MADNNTQANILALGDDIHHIIATELLETTPSSLLSLAQVSRPLGALATPYIYRELVLSGNSEANNLLINRLRSDGGDVARHVRHLAIEEMLSPKALEEVLDKTVNLRTLSWDTATKMPESILQKLQNTWPDLKISVCNHKRAHSESIERDMDEPLLTSPQLESLDYSIYIKGYNYSYMPQQPMPSEWRQFSRIIQSSKNLKRLRIELQPSRVYEYGKGSWDIRTFSDNDVSMPQFVIDSKTSFPPLEELTISNRSFCANYEFDAEHCKSLRTCIDWSKMRKLDVGSSYPVHLFRELIGLTPNLTSLRFGFTFGELDDWAAVKFIQSLNRLETLDIANVQEHADGIWPAIVTHRNTLKILVIRPTVSRHCYPIYPDISLLRGIIEDCPNLENFGYDVPFEQVPFDPAEDGDMKGREPVAIETTTTFRHPKLLNNRPSEEHITLLSELGLDTLELFLHIPGGASSFCDAYIPDAMGTKPITPLKIETSKKTAIEIAQRLSKKKLLKELRIWISRTGYEDRAQSYLVHANMKLTRKEIGGEGEDAWDISGDYSWKGEAGW
ncbi:hypothetical protein CC78DRAFT_565944 [Lojkania enalia]|uniref:Uncharacterized protein n=1 Tax=Lojkania enalia TaxID=147567 RepID=A0A9P4KFQ8_9PLEO|nr:hypothetical protein CC78DRAFT_565944 [Didymosphaeria enalia]